MKNKRWFFLLLFISSNAISQNEQESYKKEPFREMVVYRDPDVSPVPEGAAGSFLKVVERNLDLDQESIRELGISDVKIVFELVVNTEGKVISCSIVDKNELIHVKNTLIGEIENTHWIPGECGQSKVTTIMKLPVSFKV